MQTLGISDKQQEPDNIFRRLLWPSNHPSDIDLLGQQGFWVCAAVSIVTLLQSSLGHYLWIGLFFAIVFLLGGMGVREHSTAAAVCVWCLYLANLVLSAAIEHNIPGILSFVILILLFANIRGTWIASSWTAKKVSDEDLPQRFNENWRGWLIDVLPSRVWPRGRYIFFPMYGVAVLLMLAGGWVLAHKGIQTDHPDAPEYVVTPTSTPQ